MKKSSGVRLQELPFFSPLQYCHTDRPVFNFFQPLFLDFFLSLFLFLPLSGPLFPCSPFFSPDVSPFLDFFLLLSHLFLRVSSLSPLFLSPGIACLIFYLCGGAAGWIRAWTGPTNHPDLQDSFSITSPMLFHLYKYKHGQRATEHEGEKKVKIIERDKNKQERTNVEFYEVALSLCKQGEICQNLRVTFPTSTEFERIKCLQVLFGTEASSKTEQWLICTCNGSQQFGLHNGWPAKVSLWLCSKVQVCFFSLPVCLYSVLP